MSYELELGVFVDAYIWKEFTNIYGDTPDAMTALSDNVDSVVAYAELRYRLASITPTIDIKLVKV